MIFKAEELSYKRIRELDKRRTLCFLPVSALEVHGPHLPLGMDFYMARWMAEESGRRFAAAHPDWHVVQYPALPLGTDELPLPGSMDTNQKTVHRAVVNHGESLARAGFKYIVVTNGHGGPRHAAALEAACREVSRRHDVAMFSPSIAVMHAVITGVHFDFVERHIGRPLSETEKAGLLCGEHAGAWETSFMLAQNPELVEPEYRHLEKSGPPLFRPASTIGKKLAQWQSALGGSGTKLEEISERIADAIGWLLNVRFGYGGPAISYKGDPSVASAEIGEAFRDLLGQECLALVEDVTSGRKSAVAVRSLASDSKLIQPGFWPAVGVATAAAVALLVLL